MKKENTIYLAIILTVLALLLTAVTTKGQDFLVEKVTGKVAVLSGSEEYYTDVATGQMLSGTDVLVTEENSSIRLSKNGSRFLLKSNSALGLNFIKEVTINDLLLALTMEEVRSIRKSDKAAGKSTAVYGSKESGKERIEIGVNTLGFKRINGARQLAESGYKESAVIAAKETYRKYPVTKTMVDDRLFFANILKELGLYNEALGEYKNIMDNQLSDAQEKVINNEVKEISIKLSTK